MNKRVRIFAILLISIGLLIGCSDKTSETGEIEGNENSQTYSNELRFAYNTQPPTLDPHLTTAVATRDIGLNVFETLVALNTAHQPVSILADAINVSTDGKTYTFHLREGIPFHNGKEMTAEDVVASMERWLEKTSLSSLLIGAKFESVDTYTVELHLEVPSSSTLHILATPKQIPGIMPKEIIEATGDGDLTEFIGTGPFMFEEWRQDQFIHLKRFEDYVPLDYPADGLAGKREALVDNLYYDIVPDGSTRLAGIQTGQYDIAFLLPYDSYEQLEGNQNVKVSVTTAGDLGVVFNKKEGLFTETKMREAVNAALNPADIMRASFSNELFYTLNSGYMLETQEDWFTTAGQEVFELYDTQKVKAILDETGYSGEEITLLTTRDYEFFFTAAVVVQDQLEKAGFNVSLEVYDWPTLVEKRGNPDEWDLLVSSLTPVTTPTQLLSLSTSFPGWTEDDKIAELLQDIHVAETPGEAKAIWSELQGYAWEYLPLVKFGDFNSMSAATTKTEGYQPFEGLVGWNIRSSK